MLSAAQAAFLALEIRAAGARPETWADQRQRLSDQLKSTGKQHLILVRYQPQHNVHHEWVFNDADLEHAPVLWARSWRPDLDQQLLQHYQGQRSVWLLELDRRDRGKLMPYEGLH
jgi:hypothetical protein